MYKDKYLKYKSKYLNLKNQIGNGPSDDEEEDKNTVEPSVPSVPKTRLQRKGVIKKDQGVIKKDQGSIKPPIALTAILPYEIDDELDDELDELDEGTAAAVPAELSERDRAEQIALLEKVASYTQSTRELSQERQKDLFNQYLTREQSESLSFRRDSATAVEVVPIGTAAAAASTSMVLPQRKLGRDRFGAIFRETKALIEQHMPDSETKLIDCYIASSHNTYFSGNQVTGNVSVKCYTNFIKYFKGGCVEFDPLKVVERIKNSETIFDIKIGHKSTPSNTLFLSDILVGIKEILDNPANEIIYPIIFSFDNKDLNKYYEHQQLWFLLKLILRDYIYLNFDDDELKLKNIKRKILIKWKQCTKKECITHTESCNCKQLIKPLKEYFDVTDKWTHMNQHNTISLVQNHKYTNNLRIINDFLNENSRKIEVSPTVYNYLPKFIRKYPSGRNIKSGNYPFLTEILYGVNMVALNMQKQDIHTMMMIEFFRDSCLRLKPSWFYNQELETIPVKNYIIYFDALFTDIFICDEIEVEKMCKKGQKKETQQNISIALTSEIEIIYVKLKYDGNIWHGGITLYRPDNCLYLYMNKGSNCDWLSQLCIKININVKQKPKIGDLNVVEIIPVD
jgi:hypothetical protein